MIFVASWIQIGQLGMTAAGDGDCSTVSVEFGDGQVEQQQLGVVFAAVLSPFMPRTSSCISDVRAMVLTSQLESLQQTAIVFE